MRAIRIAVGCALILVGAFAFQEGSYFMGIGIMLAFLFVQLGWDGPPC